MPALAKYRSSPRVNSETWLYRSKTRLFMGVAVSSMTFLRPRARDPAEGVVAVVGVAEVVRLVHQHDLVPREPCRVGVATSELLHSDYLVRDRRLRKLLAPHLP
jgi:hypothetical protein